MLHPVTFRALAFAACGWLLACDASALALGRVRGTVLVGRPLELTVPVTLDGADGQSLCADADLFMGEQKVAHPPTVRFEPGPNRQGQLRIQSAAPVDEPMITVYLRIGCGQSVTRRYVMLSELPPDNELPVASRPPVVAQAAPVPSEVPNTEAMQSVARRPRPAPAPKAPVSAAATPRVAAAASGPRKAEAQSRHTQPRLKVDMLDLAAERDPALRMSSELNLQPTTDPQARSRAASLWAVLQRSPEDILRDGERAQALEHDLGLLRAQTQQNATAITQVRAQVEEARSDRRQAAVLAIALLVTLAALAGWLLWQWRRARRLDSVNRWFESPREPALARFPVGAPIELPAGLDTEPPEVDVDVVSGGGLVHAAASAIGRATPSGWGHLPPAEFQTSAGGTNRMVGVQDLIDVHDTADFFVALGQHDQAIAVLEAHVHDQAETSALPWMDLLEMYFKLGKRSDFERLRSEFRERFAVQVPDFDRFDQPTSSLENYGAALSRIVALWPSQRVLDVIEESIFRKPGLPGAELFSLEAYRELVLLYHIAKEGAPGDDSISAPLEYKPTDFPPTSLQPLNVLDLPERPARRQPAAPVAAVLSTPEPAADDDVPEAVVVMGRIAAEDFEGTLPPEERNKLMTPPASQRIGLDIDLDAPGPDEDAADAPSAGGPLELQPLDFDTSVFDGSDTQDPSHKA